MNQDQTSSRGVLAVLILFLLSRLILESIGFLSVFYFPSARTLFPVADLQFHAAQSPWLEMWARWDSEWYVLIAEKGYASFDQFSQFGHGKYLAAETSKFFPAYPMAIRALNYGLHNSVLSGFLISNAATLLFLFFFFKLTSSVFNDQAAFQASLLYILFPTSFFLSAVYSESLFLAMALAAFYFLEKKQLIPAAIATAIVMITRPTGVLAAPALLLLTLRQFRGTSKSALPVMLLAILLPLAAYAWFIQQTFGTFRWITDTSTYWRGQVSYPLYALVRFFRNPIAIHGQHNSMIDFGFAALNLLVLIVSLRKLRRPTGFTACLSFCSRCAAACFRFRGCAW